MVILERVAQKGSSNVTFGIFLFLVHYVFYCVGLGVYDGSLIHRGLLSIVSETQARHWEGDS